VIREQYYLDFLYPEYNILSIASSSLGKLHTEKTKNKISNSLKGKSLSEETKQKMSESRTGKVFSEETKKILSDIRIGKNSPFLNKNHSEETKQKMSEAIGSKVEAFNKETNETKIYSSNCKAAEAIGCSEFTVRYYIKNKKLYKDKYLFKKSDESDTTMSQEIREKLRKLKGKPVYMYSTEEFSLLYIFESKQQVYSSINMHHVTLNDCLYSGKIYLDNFFFSLDFIEESLASASFPSGDEGETSPLGLDKIKSLVLDKREVYNVKHPAAKSILGEFKDDSKKNIEFHSLTSLAKHLKGDRQVIREYLTGVKSGYYRGKWKFTYKV
jgi:group I intron endonuclease